MADARAFLVRRHRWVIPLALCSLGACGGVSSPSVVPAPPPAPPDVASTPAGRAALALAAANPRVPPSVQVTDDTVHYRVTGRTVAELAHSLGVGRGANADSDYIGATVTQLRWEFAQRRIADSCTITSVTVFLRIETRLPEWARPPETSQALVQQWMDFLAATERHENGHRNIALHTATSIAHALGDEHGLPCAELDEMANASAGAQWELGNQHQLAYDAATRHGVMQGSRWPPFVTGR